MAARTIITGPSPLRTHLKSNLQSLRRSPCLLVTSVPPAGENDASSSSRLTNDAAEAAARLSKFRTDLSETVNRATFTAAMECNLRTASCTVSGAYPTWADVEGGVEQARRVGATTILGAGAGAAIDLAKGVAGALAGPTSSGGGVKLVLAPSTLGGTMSAMSSAPLILCPNEEALLPPHLACGKGPAAATPSDYPAVGATVCLDGDVMSIPAPSRGGGGGGVHTMATPIDAALASLTICLDSALSLAEAGPSANAEETTSLIEGAQRNALNVLDLARAGTAEDRDGSDKETQQTAEGTHAAAAVAHAGQLLRYGTSPGLDGSAGGPLGPRRSVLISLASSLLPRYFPHGHVLAFMASLLPGLCQTIHSSPRLAEAVLATLLAGENSDTSDLKEWSERITEGIEVPKSVDMVEGTPDVRTMMRKVEANSALAGSDDPFEAMEGVLHRSLDR